MTVPATADIVVIGSGPSGSTAAGLLAKAGYDVVILDAARHPRLTVGENIIPDMWRFADLLGASEAIAAEGFVRKAGGRVSWGGKVSTLSFKPFGYDRPALHVEREVFDQILVRQAQALGAALFEDVVVEDVVTSEDQQLISYRGADGSGSIIARHIVDASGQKRVLSRKHNSRVLNPDFRFVSLWGYFRNSRYFDLDGVAHDHATVREIPPATYQISIEETGHTGWCWHIPMRETTSVGFVLPQPMIKKLKAEHGDWVEAIWRLIHREPSLHQLMSDSTLVDDRVHFINNFSGHSSQVAGPGFVQVGDAAGFFDPIFSIGVTLGMYSGALAAQTVGQCLSRPQKASRFRDLYARQLAGRIELSRGMALPHYASAPIDDARARRTLAFTGDNGLALIKAAAAMSSRSGNVTRLLV